MATGHIFRRLNRFYSRTRPRPRTSHLTKMTIEYETNGQTAQRPLMTPSEAFAHVGNVLALPKTKLVRLLATPFGRGFFYHVKHRQHVVSILANKLGPSLIKLFFKENAYSVLVGLYDNLDSAGRGRMMSTVLPNIGLLLSMGHAAKVLTTFVLLEKSEAVLKLFQHAAEQNFWFLATQKRHSANFLLKLLSRKVEDNHYPIVERCLNGFGHVPRNLIKSILNMPVEVSKPVFNFLYANMESLIENGYLDVVKVCLTVPPEKYKAKIYKKALKIVPKLSKSTRDALLNIIDLNVNTTPVATELTNDDSDTETKSRKTDKIRSNRQQSGTE